MTPKKLSSLSVSKPLGSLAVMPLVKRKDAVPLYRYSSRRGRFERIGLPHLRRDDLRPPGSV